MAAPATRAFEYRGETASLYRHCRAHGVSRTTVYAIAGETGVSLAEAFAIVAVRADAPAKLRGEAGRSGVARDAEPYACVRRDWRGVRFDTAVDGVFRVCPLCGGRVKRA